MNEPPNPSEVEYAGFWIRVLASIIDTVLVVLVTLPIMGALGGAGLVPTGGMWSGMGSSTGGGMRGGGMWGGMGGFMSGGLLDLLVNWLAPAAAVIAFWHYRQATPGKMLLSMRVVDARTGQPLTVPQSIVRYLGYFVSIIPLCLGLIWVAFDSRKQGWHDKIAGTVVIRSTRRGTQPVRFEP